MAFQDFSFQGVPYHRPEAPVTPVPDDTAARTIAAGTQTGVMGFVHMAIAAQQAKLEQEKILQQADLEAQRLQHQDKWQQQDYDVASANQRSEAVYRDRAMNVQEALQQPRIDEFNAHADYWKTGVLGHVQASQQKAEMLNQFAKDAASLEDSKAWVNDPLGQAAKVMALTNQYAGTTDSGVKEQLAAYQDRAKESKLLLPTIGGTGDTFYTASQVADDLARNGGESAFITGLVKKGYIKTETSETADGTSVVVGFSVTPRGKDLIGKTPAFRKAQEAKGKLIPGSGKVLKEEDTTAPVIDLGVQKPPSPAPTPELSQREKDLNDAKRYVHDHPDRLPAIQAKWQELYPGEDGSVVGAP